MSLKDFFVGEDLVMTSLRIPRSIKTEVEKSNMTLSGAFVEGWKAIQQRKEYNVKIPDLEIKISRMSRIIDEQSRRIQKLETGGKN